MKLQTHSSRRTFLAGAAGAGALTMLKRPAWAFDDVDPRAAAIVASSIGVDTHNHIDVHPGMQSARHAHRSGARQCGNVVAALKLTIKPVIVSHTGLDSQLGRTRRWPG